MIATFSVLSNVYLSCRLVYPMLPVSLDCPLVIATSSMCTLCCPVSLCTLMLSVFSGLSIGVDCFFVYCLLRLFVLSSCVPYVVSFSGLLIATRLVYPMLSSSLYCFSVCHFVLCILCCQFLWIVR